MLCFVYFIMLHYHEKYAVIFNKTFVNSTNLMLLALLDHMLAFHIYILSHKPMDKFEVDLEMLLGRFSAFYVGFFSFRNTTHGF